MFDNDNKCVKFLLQIHLNRRKGKSNHRKYMEVVSLHNPNGENLTALEAEFEIAAAYEHLGSD